MILSKPTAAETGDGNREHTVVNSGGLKPVITLFLSLHIPFYH